MSQAAILVKQADYLLVDFDGPICSIFAGLKPEEAAALFRQRLESCGIFIPLQARGLSDPLEIFRITATVHSDHAEPIQRMLASIEAEAVKSASPTPYAHDVLISVARSGRRISIVSNNSEQAIRAYLRLHALEQYIFSIAARDHNPSLMKPSPYLIDHAVAELDQEAARGVLVGDSVSDIAAAREARIPSIGYANNPGKDKRLANAGADAIIMSMGALITQPVSRR